MNKIRVIITGATGMVGEGVLHECLLSPDVEKILVVSRRPCGISASETFGTHPCPDFFDLQVPLNPHSADTMPVSSASGFHLWV